VMNRFRSEKADLLIATDVAARGLDVAQLSHVFNYDLPSAPDVYVHRIGRTGRAGREGTAITLVEPREHRHLRSIENITKQKIELQQIPTVADLRAKQLELTRASLRERLLQGDLDDVRVVIESLADEFDLVDVAAAAVKLAQVATRRDSEIEIPEPRGAERVADSRERGRVARPAQTSRGGENMARIFVGAGRQAGVRPADLVGAIAGEAGIASRELGAIEIADRFALIEVPEERADDIVAAMKKATLRGQKVQVRRDRESRPALMKKSGRTR
jgi:ATP-dependent RNA helicase DeaD